MKKTITMLLVLAGVAFADYSGSFSWKTGNANLLDNVPAFNFSGENEIWMLVTDLKINGETLDLETATEKPSSVYAGTLTPDADVGSGNSWSVSFDILNYSDESLTLGCVTLDVFAYGMDGTALDSDFLPREVTLTLNGAADASVTHAFTNLEAATTVYNWDSNPTLTFASPLVIEAGGYASFDLTISEVSAPEGSFIGLSGATLHTVPEPATAMLSLLALCGLFARRRR